MRKKPYRIWSGLNDRDFLYLIPRNFVMVTRLLAAVLVWAGFAYSANAATCTVAGKMHDSTIAVKIDGSGYVAVAAEDYKQIQDALKKLEPLKQALREAEAKLKEYQNLSATYDELKTKYAELNQHYNTSLTDSVKLNDAYKENGEKLIGLNHEYEGLVKNYDKLAGMYRSLAIDNAPLLHFDAALGVIRNTSDNETDVSVMLGASVWKLKTWYLWYPDGYSLMVGTGFGF
jgi:uncharacterized membrane-anchored protein YhcB (DUF1043 family)